MSKHGLFTDEWYPCPYCGAELGVAREKDEYNCVICGRDWTIYNFPAGINELFPEEAGESGDAGGEGAP